MVTEPNLDGAVWKDLLGPEAQHLGELYLLQGDLNAAYDALELYFTKYASTTLKVGRTPVIAASLFRDGILLYCSCFSTKDPKKKDPSKKDPSVKLDPRVVYKDVKGWKEYYQSLTDMRSAFVAHNFGPQRQHNVVVACVEREGQPCAVAFTQVFLRFAGWTVEEQTRLLAFIDVARGHLKRQIVPAEEAVMEVVRALTPEQIDELPVSELSIPSRADFRTTRKRFREKGGGSRLPLPERRLGRTTVIR